MFFAGLFYILIPDKTLNHTVQSHLREKSQCNGLWVSHLLKSLELLASREVRDWIQMEGTCTHYYIIFHKLEIKSS